MFLSPKIRNLLELKVAFYDYLLNAGTPEKLISLLFSHAHMVNGYIFRGTNFTIFILLLPFKLKVNF